ncbi:MAG: hypothetical protein KDA87_13525 [Planctomycetales bacterium]|nr:hypothetical protein [Planctomycetales bacterium]
MAVRFEILHNGQRVCISGLAGDGVLSTMVNYVKHTDKEGKYQLTIGGLGHYLPTQDCQHANWETPSLAIDDEIMIRILPDGEFDNPQNFINSPQRSIFDNQFGKLDYNINAWDGEVDIDCRPLTQCRIHLWADEDGPTDCQRQRFAEFADRHDSLWPSIANALVRCHLKIQNSDDLIERIDSRMWIDMPSDASELQLTYSFQDDPKFRRYSITLRNWEIVEVYTNQ